jgi:hypothetical protein
MPRIDLEQLSPTNAAKAAEGSLSSEGASPSKTETEAEMDVAQLHNTNTAPPYSCFSTAEKWMIVTLAAVGSICSYAPQPYQ